MLKAYDYFEYAEGNNMNQQADLLAEETELSKSIVLSIKEKKRNNKVHCLCSNVKMEPFFEKWGIEYCRCPICYTITANVSKSEIDTFKNNDELINFRTSPHYQEEAAIYRKLDWEELLDWIYFRTYRYIEKKCFSIVDYGNRYEFFAEKINSSRFCEKYELRNTIIEQNKFSTDTISSADIVLHLNHLQQSISPIDDLIDAGISLRPGGLLFFSTRIGTGFDILALTKHSKILPYDHIYLPSISMLKYIFAKAGYRILEISTPGRLDVIYVKENKDKISDKQHILKLLMEHEDKIVLQELQRFLQKSEMSSYVQIVAQKGN